MERPQLVAQEEVPVRIQVRGQGVTEDSQMAADVVRERSEQVRLGSARQQTVEQAQAIDAEQVREDPADADPRRIEDLVDAVAHPRPFAHHLAAQARDLAQGPERSRGNQAGATETELADARQPQTVGDIGLAAPDLLDVLRMDQQRAQARLLQCRIHRLPVDPGPFHQRGADLMVSQPRHQILQSARQGAERLGEHLRFGAGTRPAHGRGDLHLVHIQPGGASMDDMHRIGVYHQISSFHWG